MARQPYAPARFEYRIWGDAFPELPAPDEVAESREIYLLATDLDGVNVKFRRGALEVKRLLGTRASLQHWLPALRCPLPLPARVIERDLCPALGVPPPRLRRRRYGLEQFLREVASALPGVRSAALIKRRRSFEVAGSRAERTRIWLGKVMLESAAVEAEGFEAAAQAAAELGLERAPNLDYITAIRRLLAGDRLGAPLAAP